MKILLVMQFFYPEPDFKGLPFARELARRGHEVEVLTGFPNYPGGKVYPGYRIRPFQREVIQGIRVNRVPLYPSHDSSVIGRVMNYSSFAFAASTLGALAVRRPDVAYVYHPPATVGLAATSIRALRGVPFVYDIMDLWPDTLASTGMLTNRTVLKAAGAWCRLVYRSASRITVVSPGFKARLTERGVPAKKISVIPNWAGNDSLLTPQYNLEEAKNQGLAGKFNILFAGTMGKAQALDSVLDAAAICANRKPQVQFVFVGGGIERARLEEKARTASNIRFLPARAPAEMPSLFSLCDVLLVHLKKDPLFEITIPSKTQSYLAAGKPILMAVPGNAADIVTAAGAGLIVPPQNPASLAEAALNMAAMPSGELTRMGESGKAYYFREMSFDRGVTRFEELFADCKMGRKPE